ncbi:hypothetical protein [Bacillus subtilis]|uniref:hypothetical protein n=1 Tax=Bacillus subtilis TaxID=1423 RepID=UPI000FF8AA2C|nr:hypothetical protein [Bacillus subtilis]QAS03085.1 hypothetical protein EQJ84_04945 [Bacillus subtilis]QAS19692.1 hypothetical protein EQJ08_04945 [Bacillus subtilis]WOA23357.1 hypothetical protein RW107_05280 [Bacillus subtilis]CAF1789646.1 hypothetical protein NRS6128_00051 [Bacillus subtilis]CAI6241863.1 putative protein YhcM [Bacillus subtilis]
MLFNQRRGISPAALIIGSTMLIAALSPQIRHRISGFITGQMNRRNSENNTFDASNVGNMVKQAFSRSSGDNQDRSQHQSQRQNGRQHQQQPQHQHTQSQTRQTETPAKKRQPHYAEPIHFEQSAMNVMDDNTMMEMLEDLEPGR